MAESTGRWYCHVVRQDVHAEPDLRFERAYAFARETRADRLEHGATVLDLHDDGTYALTSEAGGTLSSGRWSAQGASIQVRQTAGVQERYAGVLGALRRGEELWLDFEIDPERVDDGDDRETLVFRRARPRWREDRPLTLLDELELATQPGEIDDALQEHGQTVADVAGPLWDAWLDGRFAADPLQKIYATQLSWLERGVEQGRGAIDHARVIQALQRFDPPEDAAAAVVAEAAAALPELPQGDAEIASLLSEAWAPAFDGTRFER